MTKSRVTEHFNNVKIPVRTFGIFNVCQACLSSILIVLVGVSKAKKLHVCYTFAMWKPSASFRNFFLLLTLCLCGKLFVFGGRTVTRVTTKKNMSIIVFLRNL